MQYIHIKNLEKYNPGYTDRSLIWCKIYFTMINASYDFETMDDIDKWRLIALIMLELQMKKPIPYDEKWLQSKISNNKRPISLTLKMLHNFLDVVTQDGDSVYPRVEKSRVEESRVEENRDSSELVEIINDLNEVLGSKYGRGKKTNELISARIKEGFTVEDFKIVHRKMLQKWGADDKMSQYLRPETLYSNKFDSYLNMREHQTKLTEHGVKAYIVGQAWLKNRVEKENAERS